MFENCKSIGSNYEGFRKMLNPVDGNTEFKTSNLEHLELHSFQTVGEESLIEKIQVSLMIVPLLSNILINEFPYGFILEELNER